MHLAIGTLGLVAYSAGEAVSRKYAVGLAAVYGVVAVAGLAPQQFFGIIPVGGADIALHAATALVALGAFVVSGRAARSTAAA